MIQADHPQGGHFIMMPQFLAAFYDRDLLTYNIA